MCGIVGFTGRERAVPYLMDCLERLEYRGYDSAGIALSGKENINVIKRKGKLSVLTSALLSEKKSDSLCGIGHTRWATHGVPDEKNAHPHFSMNKVFAVVHNGIIENYEKLKNELVSRGYVFVSDTDTEVIAHLLEKNYQGDFVEAARKTFALLEGSYAVAVLCKDYPGKIFCCRWGSPIVLARTEKGSFISSDVTSLLKYTDEVYKLEGGESALVGPEKIEFFDKGMSVVEKKAEKIIWSVDDARKNGYEHFMLKEIFEQGETVERMLSEYVRDGEIIFPDVSISDDELKNIKRIVFVGCGSAYHAGFTGKLVAERLTGIYSSAEVASEWRYGDSPVDSSCLCVFISQSGETADTIAAIRKAKAGKAKTLGIVNVVSSTVADECGSVLYTRAGPEIAVATTKAYTAQLISVYLLALKIATVKGNISAQEYQRLIGELRKLSRGLEIVFEKLPGAAKDIAREYSMSSQMYFIGRNTDFAAALEGALKLKEISYIPCEAYAAGELKHGTISLIEKGTAVVALMGSSKVYPKTLSNIREVRARGAAVIALSSINQGDEKEDFCDRFIALPETEDIYSAVYEGVALQLVAYYIALERGCDIDKPRNLAKSVTVE